MITKRKLAIAFALAIANIASATEKATIENINITSKAPVNPQHIRDRIQPFLGKNIDAHLLQKVLNEITDYYQSLGYINSQAFLPEQNIVDGILHVQVLTTDINDIKIHRTEFLSSNTENMIFKRLNALQGNALKADEIETQLLKIADLGSFTVKAEFAEADEISEYDLHIFAKEKNTFNFATFADNHGTEASGKYRVGLYSGFNNLSSHADNLSLFLAKTNEEQNNFNLSYDLPINSYLTVLSTSMCLSDYELAKEYQELGATGYALSYDLFLKQNLYRSFAHRLDLSLGVAYKKLKDSFERFDLDFKKHTYQTISHLDYYFSNNNFRYEGLSKIIYGRLINDDNFHLLENNNYFIFNQSSNFIYQFHNNAEFNTKIQAQIASRNLDGNEQMAIGGADGIAAYDSSAITGDNAFIFSTGINFFTNDLIKFSIGPHFDYGIAKIKNYQSESIYGAGIDTNISYKGFFSKLQFNFALKELEYQENDNFKFFMTLGYQYY